MNQSLKLTCFGAAGEVTGSKHLIETPAGSRILLDCGMFQGRREIATEKNCCFGFDPSTIDAVLLSHAHIDHSGLLPKLGKEGYDGPIYTSKGTQSLSEPMLLDSAHIQQEDERFVHKHHIESPIEKKVPLYDEDDVIKVLKQFVGKPYDERFRLTDDVDAILHDAGHVFGSEIIVLFIKTPEGERKLVFTGDLGRPNMPIIQDPTLVDEADFLICESTYGDRMHERVAEIEDDLKSIVTRTAKRGGKILIPAFALERTQEIILRLENLIHKRDIPGLRIYVDSPLAGKLTQVFEQHPEYYDEEMKKRSEEHGKVFSFANLDFTESVDESKKLNDLRGPAIIIAGSGMCENGRIRHHLKNHIEDPMSSILIVGYQAEETLGRKLVKGEKRVRILGREYDVKAELHVFTSLSAHADMNDLDAYVKHIRGLKKIFLVHGEETSRQAFAKRVEA
ncbi:MAG: MBL fold metallo-hydrolase, partial [Candidatus Gracilibacteria bacterium]|nr:MBL fold metallo-hydrolase [Candidatus Gracilibacteria bacterium]